MKPFPILRHLLAAVLLLPLLCACAYMSEDYGDCDRPEDPLVATGNHYINLSIVVSAGSEGTRANPKEGEDGDGREAGFERENEVTGITLMLYEVKDEDETLNNLPEGKVLAFMEYYPVTLVSGSRENQGTSYPANNPSQKQIEAKYTTGNQSLKDSKLNLNQTYRALVVANLDLTKEEIFEDPAKPLVKEVLDYTLMKLHDDSNMGAAAKHFVMSLETDYLLDFSNPTNTEVTPTINGADVTYFFEDIIIERLAARVDFWAKGATYNNTDYTTPGYEYAVKTSDGTPSNDKFVLTAVTPFNLYDSEEYLFKRIGTSKTDFKYLASEDDMTAAEAVLDPYTLSKTTPQETQEPPLTPSYTHPLSEIVESETPTGMMPMSAFQAAGTYKDALTTYTEGVEQADNLIICYPKENTLPQGAPLYDYATGLRIEGDYYKDGEFDKHLVYYGFLRHEGEGDGSYEIYTKEELEEKKGTLTGQSPMNFGIVRNNIYRVSIDKITQKGEDKEPPAVTWQIKVKKWDKFEHETILM